MLTQASLFGWLFFQESVVLLFELMLVLIQSKNYFHFSVDRGNKHLCSFLWLFHTSVRYVLNSASLFVRTFAFLEIDENIKQKIGKRHFSIRFKNKTFTQNLLKSLSFWFPENQEYSSYILQYLCFSILLSLLLAGYRDGHSLLR